MNYRMWSNVWIISSKKTDGRYNKGKIVGVEGVNNYLFHTSEKSFFDSFKEQCRYKVACVDCATGKGVVAWYSESELSKVKPEGD